MALLLLASACTIQKSVEKQNTTETQTINVKLINVKFIFDAKEQNYHKEVSVQTIEGMNAFDLLNQNAELEFQQYSFGKFITGINGVKPKENEYWALYVNGIYSDKGIEAITLDKDTEILFRIEKFS